MAKNMLGSFWSKVNMKTIAIIATVCGTLLGQVPNPTEGLTPQQTGQPMPIFRVTVVSRTTKAINYHHRMGSTNVDLRGTELMPQARGEARVDSRTGSTKIDTHVERLQSPSTFGPEFLTYVLWAITPEGRAMNLGELSLSGNHSNLLSTSDLQAFGLIVTAEPYFAVTQPSDIVVMENFVREDTTGTIEQMDAKYELLKQGQYTINIPAADLEYRDRSVPLQLQEARNAVAITRATGAERYAADTLAKALVDLTNAEGFYRGRTDKKQMETNAREATQMAEDARIITIKKLQDEELANERAAAAQREAQAKAEADASAQKAAQEAELRAQSEAESQRLEQQRQQAVQARLEAEQAAQRATQEKAEADAARQAALQQQQQAQVETARAQQYAQQADAARQQAEAEKEQMRQRLLQQLNLILETRDSARGLIVNMSDVLFDFNQASLKPGAREKLSKVSGIVLAYPGLRLDLEGHTDSIGSDEYNLGLSEKRADSVRSYLVAQGVPPDMVAARGLGKADPVAENSTAAGRQRNRRVEMVVSGEIIGTQIGPVGGLPVASPVSPGTAK
jgi:outer membrane protein OmpA-like peptidoglycan-associated protein